MRKVVLVPGNCLPSSGKVVPRKTGRGDCGPSRNRPPNLAVPRTGNLTLNNPLGKHLLGFIPLRQTVTFNGRNPYYILVTATHRITEIRSHPYPVIVFLSVFLLSSYIPLSSIIIDLPGYHPLPGGRLPFSRCREGKRLRSLPGPGRTRDIFVRRAGD